MRKITSKLRFLYYYIVNSIGFYPTIISLFFALLALVLLYLETLGLSKSIQDNVPFVIISNSNTARLILSSITTGIISLTVFSFTMVMLVLNQAGSNFTPRVIPGLISYKSNQRVMGLYLGTLIYTLIIMVNIRSEFYSIPLPGFSIFLAMCFTILDLGFFVYFIHSISLSIQIESILESIYEVTRNKLEKEIEKDKGSFTEERFNTSDWVPLKSPKTGYLQSLEEESVVNLCQKYDIKLCFDQPLGGFIIKGIPFAYLNKDISKLSDFMDELSVHLNFYREERPDVNYLFGFKHITESAVRALSPSLNDPGTAIKAIDYLTDLFVLRMELTDERVLFDDNKDMRVLFLHESFERVFSLNLTPIRLYGKESSTVMLRLLYLFRSLLYKVSDYPHLKPIIYKEAKLMLDDVDSAITNLGDRNKINEQVLKINEMKVLLKNLPLLSINNSDH
jgi:uncharacterized membrane protein